MIPDKSLIYSDILQTTFQELSERVKGRYNNRSKTKKEVIAITPFKPAKNYLNLKFKTTTFGCYFFKIFSTQPYKCNGL